jgi:hypothetical protein
VSGDFDNDGDIDFVAGNLGLNSNLQVVDNKPITLDYADFDNNGSVDPIFSKFEQGNYYPVGSLDQLEKQLPSIKKKFRYYNKFANSSTNEIIELFNSKKYKTLEANELKTSYIENLGNNSFKISALPLGTQIAPINGILANDINDDGYLDLIMVGNNYATEVGMGKYDASIGHVLINNGNGTFKTINHKQSGFSVVGDSKSIVKLQTAKRSLILVGINNNELNSFAINKSDEKLIEPKEYEAYAIIEFRNNSKQKVEFTFGGSYLSQTSNKIEISPMVKKVVFHNNIGNITRQLDFDSSQ